MYLKAILWPSLRYLEGAHGGTLRPYVYNRVLRNVTHFGDPLNLRDLLECNLSLPLRISLRPPRVTCRRSTAKYAQGDRGDV